jgi:poly-gamma-glutamate capsule biosynthesis protein CapA/YwtB (metallophosphatase superfamily)
VLSLLLALALQQASEPTLRLRAVGDVMLGTADPEGYLPADDGAHSLDDVREWLKDADLTFVNLEGPLCDTGESSKCKTKKTCYAFRCPTRYAKYLVEAGVDLASTANNHSGDFGEVCRRQTEQTLEAAGVTWSGPKGTVGLRTLPDGRRLRLVAFHTGGGCNDVNDLAAARAIIQQAKSEAELVVVSFHGGAEGTHATRVIKGSEKYLGENRGDLPAFAHAVIDAGADLVIGHGPHVVRGLEVYRGHLIAYSLGNFATYGRFDLSGPLKVGMVLEVELAKDGAFVRGKLLSTVQEGKGVPRRDEKNAAVKLAAELTRLDFPTTGPKMSADGLLAP